MTNIISEESYARLETNIEERDLSLLLKTINKIPKFSLGENVSLFFDENLKYISVSPILPITKIDVIFQLYDLNITKLDIINKIKQFIGEENLKKEKTCVQNGAKIRKINGQIQIIDKRFLDDCIILSENNNDGPYKIADRITKTIYGGLITYKYKMNEENNKKYCIAYLKVKDDIFMESDLAATDNEARLNVNKKIILKYLPEEYSQKIINNIDECIKRTEKKKNERKERFEKYLEECGGDRKLLKNKRKITKEEFSRRLPYFNMLGKDKKNNSKGKRILIEDEDDDDEEYFMNTEELPINEILLGDMCIVEHHLKDFKYTPLKIFEMIRDSEKNRGVDFNIEYSQINDKNFCINNEVTIFSQKLGIKVQGYGKSKEEAENKCALKLLAVIFKNIFKTYCELHEYFENKNGRYLDIVLMDENDKKRDTEQDNVKNDEKNIEKNDDELKNVEENKNKKKKLETANNIINNTPEESKNSKNKQKKSKQTEKNGNFFNSEKNESENETKNINIDNVKQNINKNNIKNEDNNNIQIEYLNDNTITNDENSINYEKNIENNENNYNNMSMTESQESLDNYNTNINNNKNMNDSKIRYGNFFLNNSNDNSHSNGISAVNNSFSSNNSMTSNKIIEELSKNKKYKQYNDNNSCSNDSKKREEMFDERMFYI